MILRCSCLWLILNFVVAEDYLSEFESNSATTRNYNTGGSTKNTNEGNTLSNAITSNTVEQGSYAESPLTIPTVPPLPLPPGPSSSGGGCGGNSIPNSGAGGNCGGPTIPFGQTFTGVGSGCGGSSPCGGGPMSFPYAGPCGGGSFSSGCGSPCGGGFGGPMPCGGGPSPCNIPPPFSPCGGPRPCGGGGCGTPFVPPPPPPPPSPCGGCGGCQALRPCLPRPPCIQTPPICPPPPLCPPPTICPIPLPPMPCACRPPPPPPPCQCGGGYGMPPRPPMVISGNCGGGGCGPALPQNDCCCNCQRPCGRFSFARLHGVRTNSNYESNAMKNAMCNSIRLREIIKEGISHDLDESKRTIQKLAQSKFGRIFNVICGTGEFSYVAHTPLYCQYTMQRITCYAFQPA